MGYDFFISFKREDDRNLTKILQKLLAEYNLTRGFQSNQLFDAKGNIKFKPDMVRINPMIREDYKKPFYKFDRRSNDL